MPKIAKRRCPVCKDSLPPGTPAWAIYDSGPCANLARKRKANGEKIDAPLPAGFKKGPAPTPCVRARNTPAPKAAPAPGPKAPAANAPWPEPDTKATDEDDEGEEDEELDEEPPAPKPAPVAERKTGHGPDCPCVDCESDRWRGRTGPPTRAPAPPKAAVAPEDRCQVEGCTNAIVRNGPGHFRFCPEHRKTKPGKKCPISWCNEPKAFRKHYCRTHADMTVAARKRSEAEGPPPKAEEPKVDASAAPLLPEVVSAPAPAPAPGAPAAVQVLETKLVEPEEGDDGDDGQRLASMVAGAVANDLERVKLLAKARARIAEGEAILELLGVSR